VKIATEKVADVVAEASLKMKDPNYSAVMVGGFVQTQQPTAQYMSAYEEELGGTESVVNVIFLASLVALCFQRAHNRSIPCMSFRDLDEVAGEDTAERLLARQPAIRDYIDSNVDSPVARKVLYLVALAMDSMT
jgi:hypothetical protein